jgi:glutamine amidotransferase
MSTKQIVVIDYGAGNLRSVVRALTHVGADLVVTSDPVEVRSAQAIVFPGVGATRDTMESLTRLQLVEPIREAIAAGVPLLGICVGMQVLLEQSEEFGPHACLGAVSGTVRRLPDENQKVPQIGWNQVQFTAVAKNHPLFAGIPDGTDFYFVHSFFCDLTQESIVAAHTDYGRSFPSALIRDNLAAVQFHPEKSGSWGLRVYENYLNWVESFPTLSATSVTTVSTKNQKKN